MPTKKGIYNHQVSPAGMDGSHRGIIDLYPKFRTELETAWNTGESLHTKWSSKHEPVTATIMRQRTTTIASVYETCDSGEDLLLDAIGSIAFDAGQTIDEWMDTYAIEDLTFFWEQLDDEGVDGPQIADPIFSATRKGQWETLDEVLAVIDELHEETSQLRRENFEDLIDLIKDVVGIAD